MFKAKHVFGRVVIATSSLLPSQRQVKLATVVTAILLASYPI